MTESLDLAKNDTIPGEQSEVQTDPPKAPSLTERVEALEACLRGTNIGMIGGQSYPY